MHVFILFCFLILRQRITAHYSVHGCFERDRRRPFFAVTGTKGEGWLAVGRETSSEVFSFLAPNAV